MHKLILMVGVLFAIAAPTLAKDNQSQLEQGKASISLPGQRPDGSVLLPNQWSLRPMGRQIELGDFPVNIAVHPQGRFVAVLHSGYSHHGVMVVDVVAERVVTNALLEEAFYGKEFSHDGSRLFC